jgi:hypothetical protein
MAAGLASIESVTVRGGCGETRLRGDTAVINTVLPVGELADELAMSQRWPWPSVNPWEGWWTVTLPTNEVGFHGRSCAGSCRATVLQRHPHGRRLGGFGGSVRSAGRPSRVPDLANDVGVRLIKAPRPSGRHALLA